MRTALIVPATLALVAATVTAAPYLAARAQAQSGGPGAPSARIAQLSPTPPAAPKAPELKPVKINPGVVYNKAGRGLAPFAVDSPTGTNYALKLVHASNGREAMMIYVTGGKPFQTKAPLGSYKIRGASGATWYGVKYLFGKDTSYFKLRGKGGSADGDTFTFSRKGNMVHGFRVTLIKQKDGNLETDPIKPEDF